MQQEQLIEKPLKVNDPVQINKTTQSKNLEHLINKLVAKYQPLQIYCFHKHLERKEIKGCFREPLVEERCDYWLLMVTESTSRIEHAVQDFSNAHYDQGSITILVHGKESIERSVNNGFTFFQKVYTVGELLYSSGDEQHSDFLTKTPEVFQLSALQQTRRKQLEEGMSRAQGFLDGAKECLSTARYNICAFMLHQAVEQTLIALIGFHMDYRSDIHNLKRLLMLSRCFSEALYDLFLSGDAYDKELFDVLVGAYCNARYSADFTIDKNSVQSLFDRVSNMADRFSGFNNYIIEK